MSAPRDRNNAEQLPMTDEIRQAAQRFVKAIRRVFPDSPTNAVEWEFTPLPSDCEALERWRREGQPKLIPPVSLWGYFAHPIILKHHVTSAFGLTSQIRGLRRLGRELLRCWRLAKRVDATNPQHAMFAQMVDRIRVAKWAVGPPERVESTFSRPGEWYVSEVLFPGRPRSWPYRILVSPPPQELVARLDWWGTKLRLHTPPPLSPAEAVSTVAARPTFAESVAAPSVTIPAGKAGYVVILGHVVQMPSVEMEELMTAMLERFPGGLTLDEVRRIHRSGHSRLAQMAKQTPWFAAGVCLPGRRGKGGYRIRSNSDAEAALVQAMTAPPSFDSVADIPPLRAKV